MEQEQNVNIVSDDQNRPTATQLALEKKLLDAASEFFGHPIKFVLLTGIEGTDQTTNPNAPLRISGGFGACGRATKHEIASAVSASIKGWYNNFRGEAALGMMKAMSDMGHDFREVVGI